MFRLFGGRTRTENFLHAGVKVGANTWECRSQARHFCNLASSVLKERFFYTRTDVPRPER